MMTGVATMVLHRALRWVIRGQSSAGVQQGLPYPAGSLLRLNESGYQREQGEAAQGLFSAHP
jgi:hypothetical protein